MSNADIFAKPTILLFNEKNYSPIPSERLTHKTKINILKDLKHPEETYTSSPTDTTLLLTKLYEHSTNMLKFQEINFQKFFQ
jgi:hypothetical protein